MVGDIVDHDNGEKDGDEIMQHLPIADAVDQRVIDGRTHDKGDRKLRQGVDQDGENTDGYA